MKTLPQNICIKQKQRTNKMKKLLFFLSALIASNAVASDRTFPAKFINAHSIGIRNLSPKYGWILSRARTEFSNAANIGFRGKAANLKPPYKGDVAFMDVNYGPSPFVARAVMFNKHNKACFSNRGRWLHRNCNKNKGISYALIELNTGTMSARNVRPGTAANTIRHEFLHVLGAAHDSDCESNADSVMTRNIGCESLYTTLQHSDIQLLKRLYPK